MGCGKHKRLFSTKRILELPIVNSFGTLTIFGFDQEKGNYIPLVDSYEVASDCTAKLAKFYALKEDEWSVCDSLVTDYSLALVSSKLRYCEILKEDTRLAAIPDIKSLRVGLFAVKNHFVLKKAGSCADMSSFTKVLCLQVIPDGLKKSQKFGTSVLMDCLLFEKKHILNNKISTKYLSSCLKQARLGFFARGDAYAFKNYELVIYVNGNYVSSGSEDRNLPLNAKASDNVIVCLWQLKAKKKKETFTFVGSIHNDNDVSANRMKCELYVETKGKSLNFKLSHGQKIKSVLQRKKKDIKNEIHGKDDSLSFVDQEIGDEFCGFSQKQADMVLRDIDKQIGVCDEFMELVQMKIDRQAAITNGIEHGIYSLFKQCNIGKKDSCIDFVYNQQIKNVSKCIKLYQAELFRECQDYPAECSQCGVAPILSIRKNMVQGPKILVIKFDRGMNNSSNKYSHVVAFDTNLYFSGAKYDLFAINCHSGSSGFGHYTSYVNQLGTNNWLYCNDSRVSRVYSRNLPNKNAQFIVYRRRND